MNSNIDTIVELTTLDAGFYSAILIDLLKNLKQEKYELKYIKSTLNNLESSIEVEQPLICNDQKEFSIMNIGTGETSIYYKDSNGKLMCVLGMPEDMNYLFNYVRFVLIKLETHKDINTVTKEEFMNALQTMLYEYYITRNNEENIIKKAS